MLDYKPVPFDPAYLLLSTHINVVIASTIPPARSLVRLRYPLAARFRVFTPVF